jgi:hypothetical protein
MPPVYVPHKNRAGVGAGQIASEAAGNLAYVVGPATTAALVHPLPLPPLPPPQLPPPPPTTTTSELAACLREEHFEADRTGMAARCRSRASPRVPVEVAFAARALGWFESSFNMIL